MGGLRGALFRSASDEQAALLPVMYSVGYWLRRIDDGTEGSEGGG